MNRITAMLVMFPAVLAILLGGFGVYVGISAYTNYPTYALEILGIGAVFLIVGLLATIKITLSLRGARSSPRSTDSEPEQDNSTLL